MSATNYAPTPWRLTMAGSGEPDSIVRHPVTKQPYQAPSSIVDASGWILAHLGTRRPGRDFDEDLAERTATAQLMASAPDLLKALQDAVRSLELHATTAYPPESMGQQSMRFVAAAARAAIEKATIP